MLCNDRQVISGVSLGLLAGPPIGGVLYQVSPRARAVARGPFVARG